MCFYCRSILLLYVCFKLLYVQQIWFPLNLKWTPGPDKPFSMSGSMKLVIIQGRRRRCYVS